MKIKKAILIKTIVLFIPVCLILSANIDAQKPVPSASSNSEPIGYDFKFEHISNDHGLSQNTILSIYQDSKGLMWLGTQDGLNLYDGYGFKKYRNDPENANSVSNNFIRSIYIDRSGVFWLGTEWGLNRFNPANETFIHFMNESDNPDSLSHNIIDSVCEDRFGKLWIGTAGGGLNKFDRENKTFTHYRHDPKNPGSLSSDIIWTVYEDRSGVLWIGTDGGGLNKFDRSSDSFIHYKHNPGDANSLSSNVVWVIYQDGAGVLWIGTDNGLNQFDPLRNIFKRYCHDPNDPNTLSNNQVEAILEDRSGIFWIGTMRGLNILNRREGTFTVLKNEPEKSNSLSSNYICAIFEDRSGILWFGSGSEGVNTLDPQWYTFNHYKHEPRNGNSLSDDMLWSLYEDRRGILWIGTWGEGFNKFDREKDQFTRYKLPLDKYSYEANIIHTIFEDRSGGFWIGTSDGLSKFDREQETFTFYRHDPDNPTSLSQNDVMEIYEDQSGVFWIGTDDGLNRFDRKREIFTHYKHDPKNPRSLSYDAIRVIYQDYSGVLWIGTVSGLNKFDRKTDTFIHFKSKPGNPDSLGNDYIRVIYEDPADNGKVLWIGTDHGLNKFDRENLTFSRYTEKDGLPNMVIYGILQDQHGFLWMSTNKGLSKFDPRTDRFRNYDVKDGLQSNEFNREAYCKSRSGELFFGGIKGLNAFFPDRIKDNPYIPPIILTSFKKFNKEAKLDRVIYEIDDITLNYDENVFSFEFSALSYRASSKNQYAYKMEGFDRDWVYSGTRREVTYTNLDPGNYTFRVKGSNNDGVWNEDGVSLKVMVLPPFWQTWWFIGIAIMAVLSLILAFYRYKTTAIRRRSHQLETIVQERTVELKSANLELQREITEREALQEKLILQQKLAVLGQLSGGIGHELRNPLGVIKNIAYFLKTVLDNPDPEVKKSLEILEKEVATSDRIITGLLDFARTRTPNKQETDINKTLHEVLSQTKVPGNIRLIEHFAESLPSLRADPEQLRQVFGNIILNAIQAMPEGGGLTIKSETPGQEWVVVSIADEGIGIPEENLLKVFEPLFTGKARGIGLGMALTKTYIEGHGGSIDVQSEIGKGTTFTVKLPTPRREERGKPL